MKFWEYMVNFFNKVECNKNLKFILESWGNKKKTSSGYPVYDFFIIIIAITKI